MVSPQLNLISDWRSILFEEGTEAAAATAVEMGAKSAYRFLMFRADHPFLFMIRDNQTGSILFMGRMVDPISKRE